MVAERRNSTTRALHEAEIDDIVGIFNVLDMQNALRQHLFVSCNLDNLPKYGPEEINSAALAEKQARTEAAISSLASTVNKLIANPTHGDRPDGLSYSDFPEKLNEMQRQIELVNSTICSILDHLQQVCALGLSTEPRNNQNSDAHNAESDRKLNIVIFGIDENRDVNVWRSKVDDILRFVVNRDINIADTYRIGRFNASAVKPRPTLVKLSSVWDKRLVLNSCQKLRNYPQRIFIASDEPADVRRKATMERLRYRANRDGKSVSVTDGVLYIDTVATYSLSSGYIRQPHRDQQ